jgi:hypothetical protein
MRAIISSQPINQRGESQSRSVKARAKKSLVDIGRERAMLGTVLLIILILLLIGALPRWGYSTDWGYYPSGGVGLLLLIIIILLVLGYV